MTLAIFSVWGAVASWASAQEGASLPAEGRKPLPGALQTLSVNGPRPGRYVCPVCDAGVHPGVLIFFKEPPDAGKPLGTILKQFDDVMVQHPAAEMTGCAICLDDGGYRAALATDSEATPVALDQAITRKEALATRLKEVAQTLELKKLTIGVGVPQETLKDFGIQPDAAVTVIVYDKQEVIGVFMSGTDTLDDKGLERVIRAAGAAAGASEQVLRPKRRR